jgi:hypothetical protein
MNAEFRLDENIPCAECGRFGAFPFDGVALCGDCYEQRGSCCPERAPVEETNSETEVESRETRPTSR